MSDGSDIDWLKRPGTKPASWTPIRARNTKTQKVGWHCEKVGRECEFCYAEAINLRLGNELPFKPGHLNNGDIEVFLDEKMLRAPLHWRDPRTVFLCSMTDAYARWVKPKWLDKMKAIQALTPQHTYIELTKRSFTMRFYNNDPFVAQRVWNRADEIACDANLSEKHPSAPYLGAGVGSATWPLRNVWNGVSVGERDSLPRLDDLVATRAAIRHASFEPLLEDLGDLGRWLDRDLATGSADDGASRSTGPYSVVSLVRTTATT